MEDEHFEREDTVLISIGTKGKHFEREDSVFIFTGMEG